MSRFFGTSCKKYFFSLNYYSASILHGYNESATVRGVTLPPSKHCLRWTHLRHRQKHCGYIIAYTNLFGSSAWPSSLTTKWKLSKMSQYDDYYPENINNLGPRSSPFNHYSGSGEPYSFYGSDNDEPWDHHTSADSGYASAAHPRYAALSSHTPASIRPVQGNNTDKYIYRSS